MAQANTASVLTVDGRMQSVVRKVNVVDVMDVGLDLICKFTKLQVTSTVQRHSAKIHEAKTSVGATE